MSICRICHAGISMGELLAPCRCRGSIAMTHMGCLERWLKESGNSNCELCQHHFQIIRKPKYSYNHCIVETFTECIFFKIQYSFINSNVFATPR